jgi:hypothetical protein
MRWGKPTIAGSRQFVRSFNWSMNGWCALMSRVSQICSAMRSACILSSLRETSSISGRSSFDRISSTSYAFHGKRSRHPWSCCVSVCVPGITASLRKIFRAFKGRSSVPRPSYIAAVHEALYELRFCREDERPEKLRLYREALATAAAECGYPACQLEAALLNDYKVWVRQEKLPRTSKK